MIVYRLDNKGNIHRAGRHEYAKGEGMSVVAGLGEYYAVTRVRGLFVLPGPNAGDLPSWDIRVYSAKGEQYRVPDKLLRWGDHSLKTEAVLPDGSIFATYSKAHPGGIRELDEPLRAAIIREVGGQVNRIELYAGNEELFTCAVSGDGSVVALCLGSSPPRKPEPERLLNVCLLFSTRDGTLLSKMDGFVVPSLSDDGKTVVGTTARSLEVWRDGKRLAQQPIGDYSRLIEVSANGVFVRGHIGEDIHIMEASSLRLLGKITRPAGFDAKDDMAISSSGKLAVTFSEGRRKRAVQKRSGLYVFGKDGRTLYRQHYPGLPVSQMSWSSDGNILCYFLTPNRLMRVSFEPN